MTGMVDAAFMRENLKGSQFEMTFGGALSFMRRNYTKELNNVDVAVSGIPFDLATTYRSGARLGPAAIRAASVQLAELTPYPFGINPFDKINVIDFGDCFLDVHNPGSIKNTIIKYIDNFNKNQVIPLTFGGDHYITYPILLSLYKHYARPISLIHFDAHCDTWADEVEDSLNHGTMFYKAIKNGIINPTSSVQVGIRTWNDDFMDMNVIHASEIHNQSISNIIKQINNIICDSYCYITVDIDCLDPAYAPGTGTPVTGGLTSHQLVYIIQNLNLINLIGADVVEVAPCYDHADITAIAAASIAKDILCLMAKNK